MAKLTYLGHGSLKFRTDAGNMVYVDPFMGDESWYADPANLVLVTHQHYDHTAIDKMLHAPGCVVWQNMDAHPDAATYLTRTFLDGDVTVEAVEAYNHHHDKDECVGYVVTVDGVQIYFSGDTGPTEQMRSDLSSRELDWVFLPGDGIYTMTPAEAGACAKLFGPQCHTVPIHLAPGREYDEAGAREFARVAGNATLVAPGKTVSLTHR